MKVRLIRNWYAPNRQLFWPGLQEVPERFREFLPSSAKIMGEDEPEPEAEDAWMEPANGVTVLEGKNGWYTLKIEKDGEVVEDKVQGEAAAKKAAADLRG